MTEEHVPDAGRSFGASMLRWTLAVAGVIVALLVLMHIVIRPIPPDQKAPDGHFGEPCVACHFVTDGAAPVELP